MLNTKRAYNGMVVAPHHLSAQAGLRVLREGGHAVEAMIAAASTIAVVYPHMNGLGGDDFWLIHAPGQPVKGIDACGSAAGLASLDYYRDQQVSAIPERGPQAAITAPRWLLGRTWGSESTSLRIESRFTDEVIAQLHSADHNVEVVGDYEEIMGHAGALVHHPDRLIEAGADPRSDGAAVGF